MSTLCDVCTTIDVNTPLSGPKVVDDYGHTKTRVAYALHNSVDKLKSCLDTTDCHLCYLVLTKINTWETRPSKTVVDDWELVDDDFEAVGSDGNCEDDGSIPDNELADTIHYNSRQSVENNRAIVLEFTFRKPARDELDTRCTDVDLYWTRSDDCTRQSVPAFSLVVGLPTDVTRLCDAREFKHDSSTASSWCTNITRLWIRKCNAEHQICHERAKARDISLPKRVIDVGDEHNRPRLVVSNHNQAGEYVCLSHCWGQSQPFKTTLGNLQERLNGFELKTLPKTFQDAITTCRNLDIKYLWIDSLCIIQDSKDDWAEESALMGKIYRDASITIFAEFADSDAGGCFMPRHGKDSALCKTPMFDPLVRLFCNKAESQNVNTHIQAKLHHSGSSSMPAYHHAFETVRWLDPRLSKPLNSRGWVLQETILSFRSIKYDQYEVSWSCPEMKACECLPEGRLRKSWTVTDKLPQQGLSSISQHDLANSWSYVIKEFTSRKLTYGGDKLPALAGLAAEMASYNKSTYLAGLWQITLRKDLAWSVAPNNNNTPFRMTARPERYRAPSWSWASIDGELRPVFEFMPFGKVTEVDEILDERLNNLCAEILECTVHPINKLNSFGEISSGTLVLRGRLVLAKCEPSITSQFHTERVPVQNLETGNEVGWFDRDVVSSASPTDVSYIWCMPLYVYHGELKILALVPTTSNQAAPFRRPGAIFPHDTFIRVGTVIHKALDRDHGADMFLSWLSKKDEQTIVVL